MPGTGDAKGNFLKSDEVCRCFIALNKLIFSAPLGSEAASESNIEGNVWNFASLESALWRQGLDLCSTCITYAEPSARHMEMLGKYLLNE